MAIKKVSEETRAAIKRKSAYSLPNRPSEAGMKPDEIKRAFYQPVVDFTLSALGEVDRVVDEINAETAKQNEQFSESVKELKATDEKMKEASEKEIAAHEEEIKRLKEGLQEADNKYVKKVVKESGVSVYTTSEQEPTLALAKGTTTDSVARRYEDGRLRVGDPVEALDAVNKRFAGDNYVGKSGDQTISGRLSVKELYVAGSTYAKDIQSLSVKDAVIVANADGVLLSELSGYVIRTGEASAYGVMYDPAADCVKIGLGTFDGENKVFFFDPDEAQPLATRAEIGHGNIPIWDAVKQTLIDSGVTFGGFDGDEFMYQTDDALSLDSIYPVKNKVIAQKIAEMELETDRRFHNAAPELKFIKTVKVWGDFSTKEVYEYAFKKRKDIDLTTDEEGNEVSLREVLLEIKAFASASTQDERLTAKFGFDESSGVEISDTVVFYAGSGEGVRDSFIHAHRIIPNLFLIEAYSFGGGYTGSGGYDGNAAPLEEALSPRTEPGSSSMEDRAIVVNTVVCPRKVTIATESAGGHIVEVNVWGVTEKYTDSDGDAFAKRSIETIMASLSATLESYVKKTGHGKETTHVLTEDSEGTIGAVPLDEASNAGTAALRKSTGALAVGDPVDDGDAVNLGVMGRKTANALIGEKSGGAVVIDDVAPDYKVLSVVSSIEPVQASGTPSPDNVLPISPWTGAKLTRCGKNLFDVPSLAADPANRYAHYVVPTVDGGTIMVRRARNNENTCSLYIDLGNAEDFLGKTVYLSANAISSNAVAKGMMGLLLHKPNGSAMKGLNCYTNNTAGSTAMKRLTASALIPETTEIPDGYQLALVLYADNASEITNQTTADYVAYSDVMISLSDATYEPFTACDIFNVDFGQEVYGGTIDWSTGVLTVDRVKHICTADDKWSQGSTLSSYSGADSRMRYQCSFGNTVLGGDSNLADDTLLCSKLPAVSAMDTWKNAEGISSFSTGVYVYIEQYATDFEGFKEMIVGTEIVYRLKEPYTIQLTPQQVEALTGTNTVFCDTGESAVTYNRDINKAFAELQQAIISLGGNV